MPTPTAADADVYGDLDLTFGLPEGVKTLVGGMAITELTPDSEVQFTAEAPGQDASIVAIAIAKKVKFSGNGSGYLLDADAWKLVKHFDFEGDTYFITKRGRAYKYNEFLKCNFSFIGVEGITAAGGGAPAPAGP